LPSQPYSSLAYPPAPGILAIASEFQKLGFKILSTAGTNRFLAINGIKSEKINKLAEGRPNIVDGIMNGEINLVINTPIGKQGQQDDSYIRKAAIRYNVPYITTIAAALASVKGIKACRSNIAGNDIVKSLQSYHMDIERNTGTSSP